MISALEKNKIQTRGRKRWFMLMELSFNEVEEVSGGGPWDKAVEFVVTYVIGKVVDIVISEGTKPRSGNYSTPNSGLTGGGAKGASNNQYATAQL